MASDFTLQWCYSQVLSNGEEQIICQAYYKETQEFRWGKLCRSEGQAQAVTMGGAGRRGKKGRTGELVQEDHVAPTVDLE